MALSFLDTQLGWEGAGGEGSGYDAFAYVLCPLMQEFLMAVISLTTPRREN